MKSSSAFVALLFLTLVSSGAPSDQASQVDDIREATFLYIFDHNASGQQQAAKGYYLAVAVDGRRVDPSETLMGHFAKHKPLLKKFTECTASADDVHDNKTGEAGMILFTGKIDWKSATEVEVAGGYYESGLSASGNTYDLRNDNGRWKVIKDVMLLIK